MAETVGVVIATFGDWEHWHRIGQHAVESVRAQTRPPEKWCWPHGETLWEARNFGAQELDTDWLIFLDADDTLDPGYIEAMLTAGGGDIRRPATLGVYPDGSEDVEPVMIPKRDLAVANYIVIGAMLRREQFLAVGGFYDWPILEDWCLFRRLVASGSVVVDVPDAIYRVMVRPESRNKNEQLHAATYAAICARPFG